MYHFRSQHSYPGLLLALTLLITGCSWTDATTTTIATTHGVAATKLTTTDTITAQVLMNMHLHA